MFNVETVPFVWRGPYSFAQIENSGRGAERSVDDATKLK